MADGASPFLFGDSMTTLLIIKLFTVMLFIPDVPLNHAIHTYDSETECRANQYGETFCVGKFLYEEVK
jgi:hypothetical protein